MTTDRAWIIHAEEEEVAELWIVEHKCDPYMVGPAISYTFSSKSGIGVSIIVSCECGDEKDVTNYARW